MAKITRRTFLRDSLVAGAGLSVAPALARGFPEVLTSKRVPVSAAQGELLFQPQYVQRGRGPHLLDWAYASDTSYDAFHSNITAARDGVRISDTEGHEKFTIDVRWNVEGFGYIFITADNGGEFYTLPQRGKTVTLNLNYELARSRVALNVRREALHRRDGWKPSRSLTAYLGLAQGYLEDARKALKDPVRCGEFSQLSLLHAMRAGELLETENAQYVIQRRGNRPGYYFGCDARSFYDMNTDLFLDRFSSVFNFATITYVWKSGVASHFEPEEGALNFEARDLLLENLRRRGITVEGRPLFWFHKWVTPEWIKKKSYDELKKYVERHTREVVRHYGERMYAWEIVNELHDWANEVQLTPDQTVELTKFACEVAQATAPKVHRLINNCCPYAEYVQLKQWSGQEAKYPQRTPLQFTRALADAGVDFTLIGQQMYFPYRDLQDITLLLERYKAFPQPLHLSEVGAPGGPTELSVRTGKVGFPREDYVWHRHWDEELQADWLEGVYTLAYSKPHVEGCHWFDFVDPYYYIENGGLLRETKKGERKAAFERLEHLRSQWKNLPSRQQQGGHRP